MGYMRSSPIQRALVAIAAVASCLPAFAGEIIRGAGATFPAPVYAEWSTQYEQSSGVKVTYEALGSGAGIERIRQRKVDFGASDAPLTSQELMASGLLQFPVVIGGVVPVINIRGIKPGQLKLSGTVLADIYLGRIRKWSDARIAALNPALVLPNANITVVHRSDSSGSSLLWTDYLSRSNEAWRATVGASLEPRWPVGSGGTGNEGVATYVQRTRFAIGYVEYVFSRKHHLSDVALRNHDGRFVQAGRDTFRAAAQAASWNAVASIQQMATDLPGAASWPITGASFILVGKTAQRGDNTRATLRFFHWALLQGEPMERRLDYVAIPQAVVEQLPALWETIRDAGGKPVWP